MKKTTEKKEIQNKLTRFDSFFGLCFKMCTTKDVVSGIKKKNFERKYMFLFNLLFHTKILAITVFFFLK